MWTWSRTSRAGRPRLVRGRLEPVEGGFDGLKDLGVDVVGKPVAHHIAFTTRLDHVGFAEDAKMLAGRGTAPAQDPREVARGELVVAERAHDLEARSVAQHVEDP